MKYSLLLTIALLISGCGKPQAEFDALQQKANGLQSQVDSLTAQLKTANDKIAELSPLAQKAKTLPVRIDKRTAKLTNGLVYQFFNLSASRLPVHVTISNPTFKRTKSFNFSLEIPNHLSAPSEIGNLEGWDGTSGDVIEVSSEGFDPVTKKFD